MKSTDLFKNAIKAYLDNRAKEDELFARAYAREGKNIDDCCTYILNEVERSGCNGFADDEIFGMAIHYYDEDKIEIGEKIDAGRVVINRTVELTEEEKTEARQREIEKYQENAIAALKKRTPKPKKEIVEQPSLFDL